MIQTNHNENRVFFEEAPSSDEQQLYIRPGQPGDESEVFRLYAEGIPEGLINSSDNVMDMRYPTSVYFDPDAIGRLWVAEAGAPEAGGGGRLVAMLAVVHDHESVAVIQRLRIEPDWRGTRLVNLLLQPLLAYCRQRSYLKVLFDLDIEIDPQRLLHIFECEGLHHSRHRSDATRKLIEFYVDLYQTSLGSSGSPVDGAPASNRRGLRTSTTLQKRAG